jgi:hypothetical protein
MQELAIQANDHAFAKKIGKADPAFPQVQGSNVD